MSAISTQQAALERVEQIKADLHREANGHGALGVQGLRPGSESGRRWLDLAATILREHEPDTQYEYRCPTCGFTRWPCAEVDAALDALGVAVQ